MFKVKLKLDGLNELIWWENGLKTETPQMKQLIIDKAKTTLVNRPIPSGSQLGFDVSDGPETYYGLLALGAKIIEPPSDEFLGFNPDVIY